MAEPQGTRKKEPVLSAKPKKRRFRKKEVGQENQKKEAEKRLGFARATKKKEKKRGHKIPGGSRAVNTLKKNPALRAGAMP